MQSLWSLASSNPGRHSQATPPLDVSLQMWAQPCSLFIQLRPSGTERGRRYTMKHSYSDWPAAHKRHTHWEISLASLKIPIVLAPCTIQKHKPQCYFNHFYSKKQNSVSRVKGAQSSSDENKVLCKRRWAEAPLIQVTAKWTGPQDLKGRSRPDGVERQN